MECFGGKNCSISLSHFSLIHLILKCQLVFSVLHEKKGRVFLTPGRLFFVSIPRLIIPLMLHNFAHNRLKGATNIFLGPVSFLVLIFNLFRFQIYGIGQLHKDFRSSGRWRGWLDFFAGFFHDYRPQAESQMAEFPICKCTFIGDFITDVVHFMSNRKPFGIPPYSSFRIEEPRHCSFIGWSL